tara:strand:+ start:209 stop:481 length:273 start_codon:yes stop_codon:yes gene_type:complete
MIDLPRTINYFFKGIIYRKKYNNDFNFLILMNGPSLIDDLKLIDINKYNQIICVNHFADSNLYTEIKPNTYLFQDTYFWSDNVRENFKLN